MRRLLQSLKRLAGPGPEPGTRPGATPAGTRVYAIGDIHGRADLLGALHRAIVDDAARSDAARRVAVYLGDYVDRGASSRGVVELLARSPLAGFESVFLRGNHDAWLLEFLDDPRSGEEWLLNGGDATLFSYGVDLTRWGSFDEGLITARAALRAAIPPDHVAFLRGLALSHVEGDYAFVHAGILPGVPLEAQKERDLLWIRDKFLRSASRHDRIVVHGHSISEEPEMRPHRIGIDTGAFATNRLTCLVLEGGERRFLTPRESG